MAFDNKPYTFDRVVRILVAVILFSAGLWLLKYLSDVLIPFAVAFLLAYLLNPLVNRIQKKLKNRIVSVIMALVLVLAVLSLAGMITVPVIKNEILQMSRILVRVAEDQELSKRALEHVPPGLWESVQSMASGE